MFIMSITSESISLIKKLYSLEIPIAVKLVKIINRVSFGYIILYPFCLLRYDGIPDLKYTRGRGIIRFGSIDDAEQMSMLEDKKDVFINRFNNNENCIVATYEDKVIGYEWFSDKPTHMEERFFYVLDVPEGSIYSYDAFIKQEYRLSGVWLKFKQYLQEYMRVHQKKCILTLIDYDNLLSMNTHVRFGYKPYKYVVALKIVNKYFYFERNRR
jgi:hypothetical protein